MRGGESVRRAPAATSPSAAAGAARGHQGGGEAGSGADGPGDVRLGLGAGFVSGPRSGSGSGAAASGTPSTTISGAIADSGDLHARTRARARRLARKDALWFLCAALNRLLARASPPPSPRAPAEPSPPFSGPHAAPAGARTPGAGKAHESLAAPAEMGAALERELYDAVAELLRRTAPRGGFAAAAASRSDDDPCSAALSSHSRPSSPSEGVGSDRASGGVGYGGRDGEGAEGRADREARGELEHLRAAWLGVRVRSRARGEGMGEVERGMLLAVFERVWLGA